MKKFCVFQIEKECTHCGECDTCDLDPKKTCNNCGKCLNLEGYDSKIVNIGEILDTESEVEDNLKISEGYNKLDIEYLASLNKEIKESDFKEDYIEDVDGLEDALNEENAGNNLLNEVFPGLIVVNPNKSKK